MGDQVHVTLEKDEQPRVFATPAYLEVILEENGVLEFFLKQPDYLKRGQVNKIELAKKEGPKTSRINKLVAEPEKKQ